MLRFYNTLSGKVEEFQPLEPGKVRMYTCGPTVYNYPHIGNFRTFVFQDILRRWLKLSGYHLLHVMNITDVDDKTIANADAAGMSLRDYTDKFAQAFWEDSAVLSIEKPETVARATDHIEEMAALIERLLEKGLAYRSDGSVYFRIREFPRYGCLSGIDLSGIKPGARVDVEEYEKSDPRDFALWKAAKPGEPAWETSVGRGRPGWHIECSAMSMKYLGDSFDIHTGGVDLVFPHHENEIAQSEGASGQPFVRYWIHCEHLFVEGEKMSKSKGNYYTLRDLLAKGHKPSALRYLLASVPRRKQLNFTFDGLHQATQSVERLRNFQLRLRTDKLLPGDTLAMAERAARARQEFDQALDDDVNTAEALAAVFDLVRDVNSAIDGGKFRQDDAAPVEAVLDRFDGIFAVLPREHVLVAEPGRYEITGHPAGLSATTMISDEEIEQLLAERARARARRDFARADQIRLELDQRGIIVEDTKDGVRWKRK
jgi:cysteinyl-tRNA synthetase